MNSACKTGSSSIYVGSMNVGQLPDRTLELFRAIKEKIPEAFLLILTKKHPRSACDPAT